MKCLKVAGVLLCGAACVVAQAQAKPDAAKTATEVVGRGQA